MPIPTWDLGTETLAQEWAQRECLLVVLLIGPHVIFSVTITTSFNDEGTRVQTGVELAGQV